MPSASFSSIASACARILQRVLDGEIKTPKQLESAWPPDAEAFPVLDYARDDVFEFWLLEPGVEYRSVIVASIKVLASASDDPHETLTRMEKAIDES